MRDLIADRQISGKLLSIQQGDDYPVVEEEALAQFTDDLGTTVTVPRPVERVVSLAPSLTESIAATRPHALLAATQ